jgi:hypothetical protein
MNPVKLNAHEFLRKVLCERKSSRPSHLAAYKSRPSRRFRDAATAHPSRGGSPHEQCVKMTRVLKMSSCVSRTHSRGARSRRIVCRRNGNLDYRQWLVRSVPQMDWIADSSCQISARSCSARNWQGYARMPCRTPFPGANIELPFGGKS